MIDYETFAYTWSRGLDPLTPCRPDVIVVPLEVDPSEVARRVALAAGVPEALWTGSTYYDGEGKDLDIVLNPLRPDDMDIIQSRLEAAGYTVTINEHYPLSPDLRTYRKGIVNVIVSTVSVFKWQQAREFCKWLATDRGIKDKASRILAHGLIVDGKPMNEAAHEAGI